jgi:hypothetical protein
MGADAESPIHSKLAIKPNASSSTTGDGWVPPPITATGAWEHDVRDEGECCGSITTSGRRRGAAAAARTSADAGMQV